MEIEEQKVAREAQEAETRKAQEVEAAKARKEQEKLAAKAAKDAEKVAKAQAAEQAKVDKAAAKEAEKLAKAQAAEAAKQAKLDEKAKAKAAAEAAKVSTQQPEQNGIRRPKADSMCGKAWGIFDDVSRSNGSPASIGETLPVAVAAGVNEATVRTQYARWRKFFGVSGRIDAPKPVQEPGQAEPAPTEPLVATP